MLKAVIFDMDGVLVDSEPVHYQANAIMLEELGVKLDYEYYKQFIGSTNPYMWGKIAEDYHLDRSLEWLNARAAKALKNILEKKGYDSVNGACELVRALNQEGYMLAVASSSPMAAIEKNIRDLGIIDCFHKLVSGESVDNPKPAPDVFLEAARQLGVAPGECIVVEDSDNGCKAARAAGMVCLGYRNPNSGDQKLYDANYVTEDLRAIDVKYMNMVYSHMVGEP